ncbi:MAG: aromatic amino acid transaminase [Chlamydiales bacterium]
MNFFNHIQSEPPDSLFGLNKAFAEDSRAKKVNLGVGTYKTERLFPYILPVVRKAEERLVGEEVSKDYLPIDGHRGYVELSKKMAFGEYATPSVYGAQVLGGTGGLRTAADFLKKSGFSRLFLSIPTWDNHYRIFQHSGFSVETYPYLDRESNYFAFEKMLEAISRMPEKSVLLLQPCCHNPTGYSPTQEQWQAIVDVVQKQRLYPFFDSAYQGFDEGVEEDAFPIRLFAKHNVSFALALSHSKNFGLYNERAGALFLHCSNEEEAARLGSQIRVTIRGLYSNPPAHGALIVAHILGNADLKKMWLTELGEMRRRINTLRAALADALVELPFLREQRGMFSYTGLNTSHVDKLRDEYAIYLSRDGRINVAGLNRDNVGYVSSAILSVMHA